MKILHTSDWHLGHTLYGFDRREEHENMLHQIEEIVKIEKPDLFLLCGDVFHTAQPSAAVNKLFVDGISSIHKANPEMTMVITAGNHDSGSRHEVFSKVWENFKIYTIGTLHLNEEDYHIIELPGKGFVIANPYIHERLLPEDFIQRQLDKIKDRNKDNLPVILTAHTTISNCKFHGHEDISEFSVGGIDSIDIDKIGEGYDYLALGHIHNSQTVNSEKSIARYSGSPIPVSFDEDHIHSISLIEISNHGETPVINVIPINNIKPLVTLPKEGAIEWMTAKELLRNFPENEECYIRLNLEVKDFLPPGVNEEVHNILKGKKCMFCYINSIRNNSVVNTERKFTVNEFRQERPIEILRQYTKDSGIEFDQELTDLFNEAVTLMKIDENH